MKQHATMAQIEKIGALSGIVSILFYVSAVAIPLPDPLPRLMAFTFPLLWIVSYMGFYHFLKKDRHTPTLEIAYIFGIIGSALACSLLVVQQANFMWHNEAMEAAQTAEAEGLLKAAFRGANRVQAGLDVAFDIFITIAMMLFGINLAKSPKLPAFLGIGMVIIAGTLLVLNMITFPTAPAESGLIDAGPFLGLWMLIVYSWFTVVVFRKNATLTS
jgi:hypothetical protein